jgi:hypothetical protein
VLRAAYGLPRSSKRSIEIVRRFRELQQGQFGLMPPGLQGGLHGQPRHSASKARCW